MKKSVISIMFLIGLVIFTGCAGNSYTSNGDTPIPYAPSELEQLYVNNAKNYPSEISASTISYAPANFKAPTKVDWSNYATSVKNQRVYPTCAAFASIAAIEMQENIDNNTYKERDYSELDIFWRVQGKTPDYYK